MNLGYWQEKVEASPRPLRETDVDIDEELRLVKEYLEEHEIEYDETDLYRIGESNMYRAYDDLQQILQDLDVSDPDYVTYDIIDDYKVRNWDCQFEYICNVIQWVENNLDEWREKYASK